MDIKESIAGKIIKAATGYNSYIPKALFGRVYFPASIRILDVFHRIGHSK
ncbi:hypothetical protein SZ25_00336 [Candidatus Arcanobacter lacustris]|uniref:Uncharacterized protein n=1 Tax=Candidatus Arcanibacter lacustris TaxID=1607817 RepID=A0A0F5MPS1_9RICK|nr:hypothetical protein SZ25_00336 [Candidatus Arcanobacter lacustris]